MSRTLNKHETSFQRQHLEDSVFNLKQQVAKLKHEILAKDEIISFLRQEISKLSSRYE